MNIYTANCAPRNPKISALNTISLWFDDTRSKPNEQKTFFKVIVCIHISIQKKKLSKHISILIFNFKYIPFFQENFTYYLHFKNDITTKKAFKTKHSKFKTF